MNKTKLLGRYKIKEVLINCIKDFNCFKVYMSLFSYSLKKASPFAGIMTVNFVFNGSIFVLVICWKT